MSFRLILLASLFLASLAVLPAKQKPAPPFNPSLPWLTDLDEALAASKKSGKPILLEFR